MTKNMGTIDRGLRLTVAAALAIAAFTLPGLQGSALQWVALAIAVVFAATSAISFCPLYTILGLKTRQDG